MAAILNALIKIHKDDKPVRPVINNIHAPSYRLAKYLNKNIQPINRVAIYIRHQQFERSSTRSE